MKAVFFRSFFPNFISSYLHDFTLIGLALLLLFAGLGQAHPPDSLEFSFDSTMTVLTIVADHHVKDPAKHYVALFKVKLNGKEVIDQKLMSQTGNHNQVVIYKIIDAKPGDKIEATAQCIISGKKTMSFIVPES